LGKLMAMVYPGGCFVHIPKTGGVWVRSVLSGRFGPSVHEVGAYHGLPSHRSSGIAFCVIREPVDWFESLWSYKQRVDPRWQRKSNSLRAAGMIPFRTAGHGARSFSDFIDRYLQAGKPALTQCYRSATEYCSHVLRFETLENDLRQLLQIKAPLPPACNASPHRDCQWGPGQQEAVQQLERWIYDTFDY
jgi:hypothetical protein